MDNQIVVVVVVNDNSEKQWLYKIQHQKMILFSGILHQFCTKLINMYSFCKSTTYMMDILTLIIIKNGPLENFFPYFN